MCACVQTCSLSCIHAHVCSSTRKHLHVIGTFLPVYKCVYHSLTSVLKWLLSILHFQSENYGNLRIDLKGGETTFLPSMIFNLVYQEMPETETSREHIEC